MRSQSEKRTVAIEDLLKDQKHEYNSLNHKFEEMMKNMDELHEKCEVYREEYNKLSWKNKVDQENERFFANHNNDV